MPTLDTCLDIFSLPSCGEIATSLAATGMEKIEAMSSQDIRNWDEGYGDVRHGRRCKENQHCPSWGKESIKWPIKEQYLSPAKGPSEQGNTSLPFKVRVTHFKPILDDSTYSCYLTPVNLAAFSALYFLWNFVSHHLPQSEQRGGRNFFGYISL